MLPIVDLAPGAEDNLVALHFADRVRRALAADARLGRLFAALKANVRAVDFDEGRATTLRFDHGRLTIHDGAIGIPSITFGGPRRALESLHRLRPSDLPFAVVDVLRGKTAPPSPATSSPYTPAPPRVAVDEEPPPSTRLSFPPPPPAPPLEPADLLAMLGRGELRIYGLVAHPRATTRFLRLIAGGD